MSDFFCGCENRLCGGPCARGHKEPWRCPAHFVPKKKRQEEQVEVEERRYKTSWERRRK